MYGRNVPKPELMNYTKAFSGVISEVLALRLPRHIQMFNTDFLGWNKVVTTLGYRLDANMGLEIKELLQN